MKTNSKHINRRKLYTYGNFFMFRGFKDKFNNMKKDKSFAKKIEMDIKASDYLLGKINSPKELTELYDNIDFMKELLLKTRDIDYYHRSSQRLKTNIDFVIFLTSIFNNDLNLLFSIINTYYYSNNDTFDNPKFVYLLSIIDGFIKNRESEFDIVYQMQYRQKIIDLYEYIQNIINEKTSDLPRYKKENNKFGFDIICDTYQNKPLQEYFANHFLTKIFYGYDFEDYIHKTYNDFNMLISKNSTIVILDYIKTYDIGLANFVSNNENLLDDLKIVLNQVIDNYDSYNKEGNSEKVNKFFTKLDDFIKEEKILIDFDMNKLTTEEIKRLGLEKEFKIDNEDNDTIELNSTINFYEEKVRLFIRTELQNLFKNKTRKLDLSMNKND